MDHLSVTARTAGFRRAGRAWDATPTVAPVADFSAEQIEALKSDPELIVVPCAAPDTDAAAGPAGLAPSPEGAAKADPARIERTARILGLMGAMPADDSRRTRSGKVEVAALQAEHPSLADVTGAERDAHHEAYETHIAPLQAARPDPDAAA